MKIELNPAKWFARSAPVAVLVNASGVKAGTPILLGPNEVLSVPVSPLPATESKPAQAVEINMNKIETFFESIGSWLKAHFKNLPSEEVQVSSAVNYVAPFVEELDTLVDPTLAPILNPLIDKIKTGLAALAVTIKAAATPAGTTNIQSIVASLAANAAGLESAFQVKDPATQTKVTGIITLISGEFNAIQQQYGTPAVAATPATV